MINRLKFAGLAVAIATIGIAVAGCGPKTATLTVEMSDFKFNPNQWSVPAGAQVTLNVKNSGSLVHEWVIMKKGEKATTPWDSHPENEKNIFWELDDVEPGDVKSVQFVAPTEPGDYDIVCGQPAHIEQGMVGTLTVTP